MNHNKAPEQKTTIDEPDVIEMCDEIDNLAQKNERAGVKQPAKNPKKVSQESAKDYLLTKDKEAKGVRRSRLGKMAAGVTLAGATAGLIATPSVESEPANNNQNAATEQISIESNEMLGGDDSVLADLDMNIDRDGIQTDGRDLEAELNQKQGPANQ